MELTQALIEQGRKEARSNMPVVCPDCKKIMQTLTVQAAGMPEAYCDPCHLSIPLKD